MEKDLQRPAVAVGGLVYNDEGKILLARSPKWDIGWLIPGGHVEWCEKLEDAIKREIKEETNIDISEMSFLIVSENIFKRSDGKTKHFVFVDYACKFKNGPIKLNEELEKVEWFEPEEALKLPMTKEMKRLVTVFIEKRNNYLLP